MSSNSAALRLPPFADLLRLYLFLSILGLCFLYALYEAHSIAGVGVFELEASRWRDFSAFEYLAYRNDTIGFLASVFAALLGLMIFGLRWELPQRFSMRFVVVAVFAGLAIGARVIYGNHPLAADEHAALFQAMAFAKFELAEKFPPEIIETFVGGRRDFFAVAPASGLVASRYWPGFSILMTPFAMAGVPWLCNPFLSAVSLLVLHRLAMKLTGCFFAAGSAVLMYAVSPAFVVNGISYFSMPAHALMNMLFVLLLLGGSVRSALAAGFVGGVALLLHNPVPHALFALPWLVWLWLDRARYRQVLAIVCGYVLIGVCGGVAWFFYLKGLDGGQIDGGAQGGRLALAVLSKAFSLPDWRVIEWRLVGMLKIWSWSAVAIVLLAAYGVFSYARNNVYATLLCSSALVTFLAYFFVPFDQGFGWGNRYLHSAFFVMPILASWAISGGRSESRRFLAATVIASAVILVPARLFQAWEYVDGYRKVGAYSEDYREAVLFVDPAVSTFTGEDLIQNYPCCQRPVILPLFMLDRARGFALMAGKTCRGIGAFSVLCQ